MTLKDRTLTVECPCPGTPHDSDTVTFRDVLPFAGGVAALVAMRGAPVNAKGMINTLDLAVALFPVYLTHAIESWTFMDSTGKPLPVDATADATLPFDAKYAIADAADDLFGGEVTAPFRRKRPTSSRSGPTVPSTSPSPSSGRRPRSLSGPSSLPASADTEPLTA